MLAIRVRGAPSCRTPPDPHRGPGAAQDPPSFNTRSMSPFFSFSTRKLRSQPPPPAPHGRSGRGSAAVVSRTAARRPNPDGVVYRGGLQRAHDVVVDRQKLDRALEQILRLMYQLDAAALAADDHDLAQYPFERRDATCRPSKGTPKGMQPHAGARIALACRISSVLRPCS